MGHSGATAQQRATARRNKEAAPGAQAIGRALGMLKSFMQAKPQLGITELSHLLDLSPSTTHRIARALAKEGFLEQDDRTDQYYLGRAAILLGQIAQRAFGLDQAIPILERIRDDTGESVNLGVREGSVAIVMLRVESLHPLRYTQPPGTRIPLHCSAMGKVFLAFSSDPAREVARLGRLKSFTDQTITNPRDLERELARTRTRGYSIDKEEGTAGVRCAGTPILDRSGNARAAIAVQVPAVRMPSQRAKELGSMLIKAADQIGEVLTEERHF